MCVRFNKSEPWTYASSLDSRRSKRSNDEFRSKYAWIIKRKNFTFEWK